MRSQISRRGRTSSDKPLLDLEDYLCDKYPETHEWLYGKPRNKTW